jgi:hypothetical protein
MAQIDLDLDDLTNAALKRMVKQLLTASDAEQKKIIKRIGAQGSKEEKAEKNDLADLNEEMRGKPNTPMVTDDDLPYDGDDELPDVPSKKRKS